MSPVGQTTQTHVTTHTSPDGRTTRTVTTTTVTVRTISSNTSHTGFDFDSIVNGALDGFGSGDMDDIIKRLTQMTRDQGGKEHQFELLTIGCAK
jgi:hypothetical protein